MPANFMEQLATPKGKASDAVGKHLMDADTPPCKREAPEQGWARFSLRKLARWASEQSDEDGAPAEKAAGHAHAGTDSHIGNATTETPAEEVDLSDAPLTPPVLRGSEASKPGEELSEPPSTPPMWSGNEAGESTPRALCDGDGKAADGRVSSTPTVVCDGNPRSDTLLPEDRKMMADPFGEIVVMQDPILVTLRSGEPEHPHSGDCATVLGKMLEQVPTHRPEWLGIHIEGNMDACVNVEDGLAVARVCILGLEASAVTLRVERRRRKLDAQCFLTFAVMFKNQWIGSSILHASQAS